MYLFRLLQPLSVLHRITESGTSPIQPPEQCQLWESDQVPLDFTQSGLENLQGLRLHSPFHYWTVLLVKTFFLI